MHFTESCQFLGMRPGKKKRRERETGTFWHLVYGMEQFSELPPPPKKERGENKKKSGGTRLFGPFCQTVMDGQRWEIDKKKSPKLKED